MLTHRNKLEKLKTSKLNNINTNQNKRTHTHKKIHKQSDTIIYVETNISGDTQRQRKQTYLQNYGKTEIRIHTIKN